MRRLLILCTAALALLGGACGDDDNDSGDASAKIEASAEADSSTVCAGRDALDIASAYESEVGNDTSKADYGDVAAGLDKAADAAPSEIKADFRLVADTMGPFLELFVDAEGDFVKLAQDPGFQAKAERIGREDVQQASERINAWFAEHC
ncbi:MAG TPA: hypothetical protein VMZ22_07120 [Acidimicrobiales bacterium]|nr:hypothetical protein [Acidimicrobiales bacterium]